ncbi:MAG: HupE/UreJ family protein [Rickettsiales bacterium]
MPDGKKLLVLFFIITFVVCSLPFITAWPEGLSGLAVTGGALFSVQQYVFVVTTLAVGFLAAFLSRDGVVLVPVCYLLMYALANMLMLGVDAYPLFYMYIFGAILLFGITLMLAGQRTHLILALIIASVGFHFGVHYSSIVVTHENPLYFLIGELIAVSLLLSISISFNLIVSDVVLDWFLPKPETADEYDM